MWITQKRVKKIQDETPNPNKGSFTVNLTSHNNEITHIIISNMLGEKVKELDIIPNHETEVQLNVPAGIYFLSATVNNARVMQKIVVE